jgi:lysozyme
MKTSQIGIDLIKHFEGLHDGDLKQIGLQPKKCPAGIWTEGYGIAMRDNKGNFLKGSTMPKGTIATEPEAMMQLANHLGIYEGIVMRKVKVPLKQNEFDALVSHTYNTGGSDTLFKLINQQAPKEQIKKWFTTKYITANGKVFQGLVNRRNAESKLYFYEQ